MEDKKLVEEKASQLNKGNTEGLWLPLHGFHAMTAFSYKQPNGEETPRFDPTSGYPVKGFVNSATGEVKFFAAFIFKKDA